ncbi:hypothetical protein ACS0TY_012850 [Phlomoides rotata]
MTSVEESIQRMQGAVIGQQIVRLSWGRSLTTKQVADELVAEFVDLSNSLASPDQILSMFQFDILCVL